MNSRSPHGAHALALLCALGLVASPVRADEVGLSVLSYNVHGVFALMAEDDPGERTPSIGRLARAYDVALFQEDFEYHGALVDEMGDAQVFRGNDMWHDPRLALAKVFAFPVAVFIPHFSPPYGSGLSAFVRRDLHVDPDVTRQSYDACSSWFRKNADCWAKKGFLRVRVATPDGAEIDVYTTHLDAGKSQRSLDARWSQLERLSRAVDEISANHAVILAGDFNVSGHRPKDVEQMFWLRQRLGLEDSGAGPTLVKWKERDFIFFRNGGDVRLSVEASGEDLEFSTGERPLSDHPAVFARFRVERAKP